MHPDDQEMTTFMINWGMFVAVVMMFGLKIARPTFQCIITEILGGYIPAFVHVFLDDFGTFELTIYDAQADHLRHLELCLERYLLA